MQHPGALQLGLGTPQRGSFLEEARRASLAARADVCVIDPEYFDEGLLGKRLLPILAHARRSLLTEEATVIPAAAALFAELIQVQCSEKAATGFDLSKLDKYRWSPCYEKFRVEEQPAGTVVRCSGAVEVLEFDLQGMTAEELLAGGTAEVTLKATAPGMVNGVLLWFRLDMHGDGEVIVSSEPPPRDGTGSGAGGSHTWGQAVQWLVPAVQVAAGQAFTIRTTFSSTRVKCDLTPVPVESGESEEEPAPVFAPPAVCKSYRAQCEEFEEVFLQCADGSLHIFETTEERKHCTSYVVIGDDAQLQSWEAKTDDDGDAILELTLVSDGSGGLEEIVEFEVEDAKGVCRDLSALKKKKKNADQEVAPAVISGTLARWQFDLLADDTRNRVYNAAIKRQLKRLIRRRKKAKTAAWYNQPEGKQKKKKPSEAAALLAASGADGKLVEVLDLGCGSGLLPMMAVRASEELGELGAVHVTGQDQSENLLNTAADIVSHNGYGRQMTLVHKDSRMMTVGETIGGVTPELKRKADLLVLENFDYGLLGEGLLPILHHACAVLLAPDAIVVPAVARIYGMLVEHRPAGGETVEGFNLDLWRTYLYRPE